MKIIEIKLYKFDELSEDSQQKAILKNQDIGTFHDWWDGVYDDAKNVGLKIDGFDIDRGSYCSGEFIEDAMECAEKIMSEHGPTCPTFITAKEFISEHDKIDPENYEDLEYLEDDFRKSILDDYLILLRNEYEYLISEDSIKESLIANDYDFTVDGKIY